MIQCTLVIIGDHTLAARASPPGTNRQIIADDSNHRFASSDNDALKGVLKVVSIQDSKWTSDEL